MKTWFFFLLIVPQVLVATDTVAELAHLNEECPAMDEASLIQVVVDVGKLAQSSEDGSGKKAESVQHVPRVPAAAHAVLVAPEQVAAPIKFQAPLAEPNKKCSFLRALFGCRRAEAVAPQE